MPNAVAVDPDGRPDFRVLIVYEDFEMGKQAMDTFNFVKAQLGSEFEQRPGMWKFDILQDERAMQLAMHDALEANMIIIAMRAGREFPFEVMAWLEGWVPRKRDPASALVALVDYRGTGVLRPAPVLAHLRQAASRAGMDFFLDEVGAVLGWQFTPLDVIVSRPAPEGWGLNE
jgi:hypothetical protein